MPDRENLIELLYESDLACNQTLCEDCDYLMSKKCKAVMMAEHLITSGMFLESKQATSDENKRWIPVSEQLPDKKGEYLVAFHPCYWDTVNDVFTFVGVDTFRGKTSWAKNKFQRVTHWMPLPEPPKEDV